MPKRRIEPSPPQRPVAAWRRGTVAAVTTLLAGIAILCTVPLFMLAFTGTTSSPATCRRARGSWRTS